MAAEHDSEVAPGAACGFGTGSFEKNCLLCGTDRELDWPDLSKLDPADVKNHTPGDWRRAAESGCPFCNIIVAVIDDAGKQHGCSVPDVYQVWNSGPAASDDKIKGFQVFLGPNEATGRYLLALEHVWMPNMVEPGEWWGTITVYLDGKPPQLWTNWPFLPYYTPRVLRLNIIT